jgi:WD40 repeat protein
LSPASPSIINSEYTYPLFIRVGAVLVFSLPKRALSMTKVFISYSRKDKPAAVRLVGELEKCELEAWIDWEDILPVADWMDAIQRGIESADGFLFLLSPDSVRSEVCHAECEHALKNGKRMIPVVVRDVDPAQVHPALAKINWIYCREQDTLAEAVSRLLSAIRTDLDWVEFHRQLQVKALEWQVGQDQSLLLRGKELQAAEMKLAGAGQKDPQPTDLQRDYVLRSRQAADHQRRITTIVSAVGIAALAVLTVIALVQAGRATASAQKEQAASTLAVSNAQTAQAASTLAVSNEMTAVASETEARRQARIALSRQLAAQSGSLLQENYPLALLLSAEAFNLSDTVEAQSSLLQGLEHNRMLASLLRGHAGGIAGAVFLGNRGMLASADALGRLILWDVSNPRAPRPFPPPDTDIDDIHLLASSPDGNLLAYNDGEGTIQLWDVSNPQAPVRIQKIPGAPSLLIAFGEAGNRLVSGREDGTLTEWTRSGSGSFVGVRQIVLDGKGPFSAMSLSSDGLLLAAGDSSNNLHLWDLSDLARPIQKVVGFNLSSEMGGNPVGVQRLALNADKTMLASVDSADRMVLWDIHDLGAPHQVSPAFSDAFSISRIVFSPDGRMLAASSCETFDVTTLDCIGGQVVLWDVSDPSHPGPWGGPLIVDHDRVGFVTFSPDGRTLASGGENGMISLWTTPSLSDPVPVDQLITGWLDDGYPAALSPDGTLLATNTEQGGVMLYRVDHMQDPLHSYNSIPGDFNSTFFRDMAFRPDGRELAAGREDGHLLLWDIPAPASFELLKDWQADDAGRINEVDWDPQGKLLASGGASGAVKLWDLSDPRQPVLRSTLLKHSAEVVALAFRPDGKYLATGGWDDTINLWDVSEPGAPFLVSQQSSNMKDRISGMDFSPDGRTLAVSSWDGTALLWDVSDPAHFVRLGSPLAGHQSLVWSVVFSPDGRRLATAGSDQKVFLWDVSQPAAPVRIGSLPLDDSAKFVITSDFSADSRVLASVGNSVTVWNVDPRFWKERACQLAGRDLTKEEWQEYIGTLLPYGAVCPGIKFLDPFLVEGVP